MKTYTVWYRANGDAQKYIFVCGVPGENLARSIANALEYDMSILVSVAWVEED